ncbi:glycosyltransferase [Paenibacillus sp. GCM10023248]|uniref:glycosyltransferase n=1 Tax=unclassified Paenibacillus TaxID=185978 RepID=UPI002378AA55|nr:glycosyltransferase [Paenibacillus sp. MAHUQ-63]MDD9266526.1 glycosyltransferase [Paenibacillus sp. MAHUQ-63]
MKKKLIFMMINMNVGGTEKALLNMIEAIPKEQFDITILMLEKYGGFLNSIPQEVHIEYLEGYKEMKEVLNNPPQRTALGLLRQGRVVRAINIMFLHLICKLIKNRKFFFNYVLKNHSLINDQFDAAVAYAGPMEFISFFVLHKIKAKKKIQWVHFDVTKIGFNPQYESASYKKFDQICVVSNEGRNKLIQLIPELKDKTEVFSNIVSSELIHRLADEGPGFKDNFNGLRILTVGRLTSEKGHDLAIRVMSKLVQNGYKVKWYCVGEGSSRKRYEELVKEYSIQDNFIFLGSDPNPYPYMKQCDIYVQPSRHEGFCITLAEARCLKKPIVTTNFTGAKEQIRDGETGLIVGVDENELYEGIVKLINDNELCDRFNRNLGMIKINHQMESDKLYKLLSV